MTNKERAAAQMRQFNAKRRFNRICTHCGKPLQDKDVGSLHIECKIYRNTKRQERRNKRKQSGMCIECGKPKFKGLFCEIHYKQQEESHKARFEKLKTAALCVCCGKGQSIGTKCEICLLKDLASKYLKNRSRWEELKKMLDHQNNRCVYSNELITVGIDASLDHKIARANGGSDNIDNLQWVHKIVNRMKLDNYEDVFLEFVFKIAKHKELY